MEKQAVITATDLCIGYRTHKEEKKVHEHLSFELYPGELTSLLGANGAGKTRFTERFISELDSPVFRLSALKALYRCDAPDNLPGSIDSRYVEATSQSSFIRSDNATQFERLTTLMLYDEVLNLIAHKVTNSDGKPVPLPESHLDRVIKAPGASISTSP